MRKYLRAANVGWRELILNDVKSMNFTDAEMVTFRLEPGDLLLNEASGSPGEVGKPALWCGEIDDCAFQNTLLRVRTSDEVNSRYLLHFFGQQAATGSFARGSRGVGIHHLGREALSQWPIPLPPLAEQRRIAAILDQADDLHAKRREIWADLDELSESIFVDMFGDPVANPYGWPVVRLGEVVRKIDSGASPVCEPRPAQDDEWGCLSLERSATDSMTPTRTRHSPRKHRETPDIFPWTAELASSRQGTRNRR
jgi:type I restriction enzyme, S subunit